MCFNKIIFKDVKNNARKRIASRINLLALILKELNVFY